MQPPAEIANLTLEDLRVGLAREFEVLLDAGLLDHFAACSGDYSPIHMSREAAAARGQGGRVAHGMLLGALLSRLVGCHLPGRRAFLLSTTLKFHQPCLEGERVLVMGRVDSVSEATHTVMLAVEFRVGDQMRANANAIVRVEA